VVGLELGRGEPGQPMLCHAAVVQSFSQVCQVNAVESENDRWLLEPRRSMEDAVVDRSLAPRHLDTKVHFDKISFSWCMF